MNDSTRVRISKHLSYVLRHKPEAIGLQLDAGGWADIDALIAASDQNLTRQQLEEVVRTSDKQRFSISENGQRIRANQGHSFPVELGLAPVTPPRLLYHGTAVTALDSIRATGLDRRARQHVHLSPDTDTAHKVGKRHGPPVVLTIDAGAMHAAGHLFFLSENGVWLTETVPTEFIGFPQTGD